MQNIISNIISALTILNISLCDMIFSVMLHTNSAAIQLTRSDLPIFLKLRLLDCNAATIYTAPKIAPAMAFNA